MDRVRRRSPGSPQRAVPLPFLDVTRSRGWSRRLEMLDIAGLALGLLAGLARRRLVHLWHLPPVTAAAANADPLGEGQPLEPVVDPRPTISGAWRTRSCTPAASSRAGRPSETGRKLALLGRRGILGRRHREQRRRRADHELESGGRAHLRIPGGRGDRQEATLVFDDELRGGGDRNRQQVRCGSKQQWPQWQQASRNRAATYGRDHVPRVGDALGDPRR